MVDTDLSQPAPGNEPSAAGPSTTQPSSMDLSAMDLSAPLPAGTPVTDRQRRKRRLARVRQAIRHGDYENALKVSVAADRVLERLLSDQTLPDTP